MKERVGFIGLGAMGKGMAGNLLEKGFDLRVCDVRQPAVDELVARGARAAENIRALGAPCNRIVFSLPDVATVEAVVSELGPALKPGHILIDCGTTHPDATRRLATELEREGITFLDAPVSGMPAGAEAGTLTIMVGGEEKAFQEVGPILNAMGEKVVYMGRSGNGQLTKMTNNVLYNIACAALAEMLPLAVSAGLDPEKICQVVSSGSGQSFAFDYFAPLVLQRDFSRGYALESAYKDMATVIELALQQHFPAPVATGAMHTYQLALARGLGKESKGAMVKVWEEVLGVEVKASQEGG